MICSMSLMSLWLEPLRQEDRGPRVNQDRDVDTERDALGDTHGPTRFLMRGTGL
jgi:hypothetical protein